MSNLRDLREFTADELLVVETLEEIIAKYDELAAQYASNPTDQLLAMSRKIDQLRFTTALQLGLSAWRCDFSQETKHKFCLRSELLATIE